MGTVTQGEAGSSRSFLWKLAGDLYHCCSPKGFRAQSSVGVGTVGIYQGSDSVRVENHKQWLDYKVSECGIGGKDPWICGLDHCMAGLLGGGDGCWALEEKKDLGANEVKENGGIKGTYFGMQAREGSALYLGHTVESPGEL